MGSSHSISAFPWATMACSSIIPYLVSLIAPSLPLPHQPIGTSALPTKNTSKTTFVNCMQQHLVMERHETIKITLDHVSAKQIDRDITRAMLHAGLKSNHLTAFPGLIIFTQPWQHSISWRGKWSSYAHNETCSHRSPAIRNRYWIQSSSLTTSRKPILLSDLPEGAVARLPQKLGLSEDLRRWTVGRIQPFKFYKGPSETKTSISLSPQDQQDFFVFWVSNPSPRVGGLSMVKILDPQTANPKTAEQWTTVTDPVQVEKKIL